MAASIHGRPSAGNDVIALAGRVRNNITILHARIGTASIGHSGCASLRRRRNINRGEMRDAPTADLAAFEALIEIGDKAAQITQAASLRQCSTTQGGIADAQDAANGLTVAGRGGITQNRVAATSEEVGHFVGAVAKVTIELQGKDLRAERTRVATGRIGCAAIEEAGSPGETKAFLHGRRRSEGQAIAIG